MSLFNLNLLKVSFLFFVCVFAQVKPSGNNYWNGNFYNQSMPAPPGVVLNLVSLTFSTDWIDFNMNGSHPVEINATYAATVSPGGFALFNVTLYGYWNLPFNYVNVGSQSLAPVLSAQFSSFCTQLSGTSVVQLCPFWAPSHFFSPNSGAISCTSLPRCEVLVIRFHFMEVVITSGTTAPTVPSTTSYPAYSLIRGNSRCPTTPVYQGQGGSSQTFTQFATLQILYGIKFTSNATGVIKRVFFATMTPAAAWNCWIYNDNTNTPVGGTLIGGAANIFGRGTLNLGRQGGVLQASDNYFSLENSMYPTLSLASGSVYWLLCASGLANAIVPTVSAGCASTSSFVSSSSIASLQNPPLVGPAGTVSNHCFFMFAETC
jgi:hypothetical protein